MTDAAAHPPECANCTTYLRGNACPACGQSARGNAIKNVCGYLSWAASLGLIVACVSKLIAPDYCLASPLLFVLGWCLVRIRRNEDPYGSRGDGLFDDSLSDDPYNAYGGSHAGADLNILD